MEQFLLNLLKTSLLGALAILLMLVSKPLWRERYRAKARCWLWLALAAFLLFPVDFSVKDAPVQAAPPQDYTLFVGTDKTTIQSTDHLFGDMAEKSGQSPAQVRDTIIQRPVTNPEQKTTRYIPVTTILFYGYLAGTAAFLLYQGVSYALFRRTVRRWKRDVSRADYAAMLSDTARDLGVSAPEMFVCEAISTPAVTGLFRPTLLLPHEGYDLNELRYILRHELCHLKRRDMLLKLVLLAANAMHWFNPVVYLMLRQADEDIELACDSAATDGLELPERAAYSRTLLAAVQSSVRALPATTCFGGTVERLKRRITNVLGAQKKRGLGVVALVLALTLTAGCAVSWGERGKKNDAPFDGTRYNPVLVVANWELTIGKNFRPLYYVSDESGTYFRLSCEDGVNTVTMIYDGGETAFAPMESVTLTQENFDGTLLPDLDALRSGQAVLLYAPDFVLDENGQTQWGTQAAPFAGCTAVLEYPTLDGAHSQKSLTIGGVIASIDMDSLPFADSSPTTYQLYCSQALGRALWAEEYGTPYGYTAINLKLKANASYATQKSIAGLVTRRGGVLRTNSYETASRMYQEGSTGAFFWAVVGVVGAALALFLLWNLFGLYWQHQRLRIGIFQAEGTSAAMLRHCGIRQGVLVVLGALLLGNLAVWGLWRWSWHSLVTRQSGRILTFAALPMAVSEYPWALHLAVCAGYLLFVLALQLAPLERLARSQPMDNLKKGV